jgi:hypothetical protein
LAKKSKKNAARGGNLGCPEEIFRFLSKKKVNVLEEKSVPEEIIARNFCLAASGGSRSEKKTIDSTCPGAMIEDAIAWHTDYFYIRLLRKVVQKFEWI